MRLRLTVTNTAGDFAGHVSDRDFDESGGTIGRSSQNDWVLPDPKKLVSGVHAAICFEQGGFFIVDRGTNGVFLNGSDSRIGKGMSARLRNGDRVKMGDFELVAEVEEGGLPPWPDQGASSASSGPLIPDDFFAGLGSAQADSVPDIHGSLGDIGGPRDSSAPLPRSEPEPEHTDSADSDSPPTNPTIPWDLGGGTGPGDAEGFPADWAMPAEPVQTREDKPVRAPEPAPPTTPVVQPPQPHPQPADAAPAVAPAPARIPEYERYPEAPPAQPVSSLAPSAVPAAKAPDRAVGDSANPAHGEASAAGLEAALALILEGAGLPNLRIPGGAEPDWFRTVGRVIGIYAAGSAELLQAISEIKDTFSIHQTQIRVRDNNPLRWATPRQAVKRLLAPDEDGFLSPTAAAADTIAGIKGHQMGAIKGMESAFKAFLLDLDPTKLARDFEAQGTPGVLVNKKAWYWEQYAKSYQRLAESARENYLDLLGDAFSEAYEQQVRIIREEAKKSAPG